MKPKTITTSMSVESVDIATMHAMSRTEYQEFLRNEGLYLIDHHDVLRSVPASYPVATTVEQLDDLIDHLKQRRVEMLRSSQIS